MLSSFWSMIQECKGRGIVSVCVPYVQESRSVEEGDVLHILIIEQSYSSALKSADTVL